MNKTSCVRSDNILRPLLIFEMTCTFKRVEIVLDFAQMKFMTLQMDPDH